jgi:hypothetical protein
MMHVSKFIYDGPAFSPWTFFVSVAFSPPDIEVCLVNALSYCNEKILLPQTALKCHSICKPVYMLFIFMILRGWVVRFVSNLAGLCSLTHILILTSPPSLAMTQFDLTPDRAKLP